MLADSGPEEGGEKRPPQKMEAKRMQPQFVGPVLGKFSFGCNQGGASALCMHFDVDDTHYLAHVLHMGEHYLQMVICAVCSMFGSSATPGQAS